MKMLNVSLLCVLMVGSAYASDNGQSDAGPALPRVVVRQNQPPAQPSAQPQQRLSDPSQAEYKTLAGDPTKQAEKDNSNCVIL